MVLPMVLTTAWQPKVDKYSENWAVTPTVFTHVDAEAKLGLGPVLQTTLVVHVVHDARGQLRELELGRRRLVVQTIAPVATAGNERDMSVELRNF